MIRGGKEFYPIKWMLAILPVMLAVIIPACGPASSELPPDHSQFTYKNQDPKVHYLGRDTCGVCHKLQYESFVTSEMGRSFKKATRSQSVAQWDHQAPVYDAPSDLYYYPFARGEDLFVLEFRLQGRDTIHKRLEQIDYIVGSGQHTNSHMREENGYFYQIPLTWYAQDGRWDLPPGFEDGHNSRFDRKIGGECMSCHNGYAEHVAFSGNRYHSVPEGIGCERCHGPGEAHVSAIMAGQSVDISKEIDYTIVHPGKLDPDRLMDLCQRCHLQGTAVPGYGHDFYDHRPGLPLTGIMDVFLPRSEDSLNSFIMASQADRMRMSACFIRSQDGNGAMSCISCHDPHKPIHSLPEGHYIQSCLNCHQQSGQKMCPKAGPEEDCMACHMPNSGSIDIPHVKITDHFIRIPDAEMGEVRDPADIKSFLRLECRTNSNPAPLLMAKGYLTHYEQFDPIPHFLDSAFALLQRAGKGGGDTLPEWREAWIRALYLKPDFAGLVNFDQRIGRPGKFVDPWTYARLGEAYNFQGDLEQAIANYEKATELARDHIDFKNKLAGLLVSRQDLQRALEILDRLIQDAPSNATAYNNRGFAFVLKGEMGKAEQDFQKALALDPDSEKGLANMASLYLNTGRKAQAGAYAQRLVQLFPDNPNYRQLLSMTGGK